MGEEPKGLHFACTIVSGNHSQGGGDERSGHDPPTMVRQPDPLYRRGLGRRPSGRAVPFAAHRLKDSCRSVLSSAAPSARWIRWEKEVGGDFEYRVARLLVPPTSHVKPSGPS